MAIQHLKFVKFANFKPSAKPSNEVMQSNENLHITSKHRNGYTTWEKICIII